MSSRDALAEFRDRKFLAVIGDEVRTSFICGMHPAFA
jgi:hypothetical protein